LLRLPALDNKFWESLDRTATEFEAQPGVHKYSLDKHQLLLNALCAKTPTPSTLLDVWETTLEFVEGIAGSSTSESGKGTAPWLPVQIPALKKRPRVWLTTDREPRGLNEGQAVDATLDGERVEVCYRGGCDFWLLGAPTKESRTGSRTLVLEDGQTFRSSEPRRSIEESFHPFRVISASPDLLLLLVPAATAPEVSMRISTAYGEQFGKAKGRLPLAVANLFFPKHTPMFAVLDAARRTERSFRAMQEGDWMQDCMRKELPTLQLGNGEDDFFHPYARLAPGDGGADFETIAGPVKHMARLGESEQVLMQPNVYLAAWLGGSSARFDLDFLEPGGDGFNTPALERAKWLSRLREGPRGEDLIALPLEELESELKAFWEGLRAAGVTDSNLRNVAHAFHARVHAWLPWDEGARAVAAGAAVTAARPAARERTRKAMESGHFDAVMRLYVHILKDRLRTDAVEER
jgi:hypothetical protein